MLSPFPISPVKYGVYFMSRYGEALAERREVQGFAAASDLAKRSKEIAAKLNDPQFSPFSQQTASRLEGDKTGEFIANARPRIQRMLSCLLGWRADEFAAHVGISIPFVPYLLNKNGELVEVAAVSDFASDSQPSRLMPPGLQEFIDEYQDRKGYEALKRKQVQDNLWSARHWTGSPTTVEQWQEFWLLNRRYLEGN